MTVAGLAALSFAVHAPDASAAGTSGPSSAPPVATSGAGRAATSGAGRASALPAAPSTDAPVEDAPSADAPAADAAAADAAAADGDVEQYVVWGVRPGRLPEIPAASTNVVFADDFKAESKSLADLLGETEGVTIRRFGGIGDRSEVTIRGSSPSQVVLTIDGVRANSVLTGGFDLSRVCLPLLDRVEITRGAGATQAGSGAVGGVVNVVTRGAEGEPTTRLAFGGGAFETIEGSALHADRIGSLDYSVGYCGFDTKGDFEFARPTQLGEGVEADFEPDSATRLNNDRVQHSGSLALGLPLAGGTLRFTDFAVFSSGGEPGIDSGNGSIAGQSIEARSRDFSNLAQLRWTGPSPMGLGDEFEWRIHHRVERNRFRDPAVVIGDPIEVTTRLSTAGTRLSDRWHQQALGQTGDLAIQADFDHDRLRSSDQSGRERARVGGALTQTLRLFDERIVLSGGGRLDWTEGFDVELLPSFGVVIAPFSWIRLRSQLGRAYRAPNFDELFHPDQGFIRGNPDLEAEDAWNFDVGLELELDSVGPFSRVRLSGAWFRREIDDSIVWVLVNPRTLAPVNTGSATTEGFELAGSVDLTRYLRLSANHTRTDSERDATGKRLPGQAEDETHVRLRIGPEAHWKLVGEMEHVGEILVNEGGGRRLPARTVWNVSASLNLASLSFLQLDRWASEIWLFAEIDNLSDEAVRDAISFPQPGRNASAGVEVIW